MNPIFKNITAIIVGLIGGSVVNMLLIMVGPNVIPHPEGSDPTTMESLAESMHLFQPRHFIFPFLAHALGSLSGAIIAVLIAANRKMMLALVVGFFFLAGGIMNVFLLPSPVWFNVVDLVLAYIPMAWLGAKLTMRKRENA